MEFNEGIRHILNVFSGLIFLVFFKVLSYIKFNSWMLCSLFFSPLIYLLFGQIEIYSRSAISSTSIHCCLPADTKTSQRRRKNGSRKSRRPFSKTSSRRLPGDVVKTSSRRRPQDIFYETSSRRLPGDVLKASLRRLKSSSKFFLVNAKDHLKTIYELSI